MEDFWWGSGSGKNFDPRRSCPSQQGAKIAPGSRGGFNQEQSKDVHRQPEQILKKYKGQNGDKASVLKP